MSKERIKDALIAIAVGAVITILTQLLELLKEIDFGAIGDVVASVSGMSTYIIKKWAKIS